ncbi:vacuolar protein sorting-associated protein 54, chloroplastic isoform X1 [Tanacetum coccineum]
MAACKALNLDGVVIVGGVTSNTNATQLAFLLFELSPSEPYMPPQNALQRSSLNLSAAHTLFLLRRASDVLWYPCTRSCCFKAYAVLDINQTKFVICASQANQETERYGSLLTLDELKDFDMLSDDYKINWHLNHLSVINPTSEDLKSRSAKIKNHRRVGNERREEQKEQEEEEEEEEDEDDEEVEKGSMVIPIGLILLKMLSEYIDMNIVLPALYYEVIHRVLKMLKYFNTRACQLVLGAGAMQSYEHEDGFVIADICIGADIQLYVDIANWTGLLWILDKFNDWYLILNMSSKYTVLILLVGQVYYGSLNSFLASFKKTFHVP